MSQLRITPTHSVSEGKRQVLGLEDSNYIPVLISLCVSFLLLLLYATGGKVIGGIISMLPFVGTVVYVLLLVHRKPPCYRRDVWDKYVHSGSCFNTTKSHHQSLEER